MGTPSSRIRRKILNGRKIELEKHTGKPKTYDELPSKFKKTRLMQFVELKFGERLENLISSGTIYELEAKLGVDATTISKWRKIVTETEEEF